MAGLDRSFGLLFKRLLDAFPDASIVAIAGMLPIITSVKMLLAPLTTMLCEKTGYRVVCTLGGFGLALGIILASQAASFALFYAFILLSGVGAGFIYCPALCLVLKYFDRRRSVANGIGMTGPYFLIPILMEYLIESYGFRGGLFIYGGICLHLVVTGFVMKDIRIEKNPNGTKAFLEMTETEKSKTTGVVSAFRLITHPSLLVICLAMLLHFFGIWPIYLVFPQFVASTLDSSHRASSSLHAAWLLTAMAASEVIARPLVGALLDLSSVRPRLKWVLTSSLLITGGASLLLASWPLLHYHFAGWICYSIIFGFFNSLLTTHGLVLIADSFPQHQVPVAASIFQFSKGIGGCVGPIVAGFILDRTASVTSCFLFAGGATLAAGVVLAFYQLDKCHRPNAENIEIECT